MTSYTVFNDKYSLFATDRVFDELQHEMFSFERSDKTHFIKFHVWQNSMRLRFFIDLAFVVLLTFGFQYFLVNYNSNFSKATDVSVQLM